MRSPTSSRSARARCPDPSRRFGRAKRAVAFLGCAGLLAGACSTTSGSSGAGAAAGVSLTKPLAIVAGENFWGSIVSQLAGKVGKVTSVVTDPNADPHSYQSSSDNARAFADGAYVVLNGAGYDSWAQKLINGNPNGKRKVLTVAGLLGKKDGDNPHFWYNPDYVVKVANQVTADLKSIDPADTSYFDAQRATFDRGWAPVVARLNAIKARFAGTPVASTESIVIYLANHLGLTVVSPPEFMNAVAEGNDPPTPSVVAFQDLLAKKKAMVLVYNRQTSTSVTTNLKKLATDRGIPIVGVTETIQPLDAVFQEWFGSELIDLENALDAAAPTGGAPTGGTPTGGAPTGGGGTTSSPPTTAR